MLACDLLVVSVEVKWPRLMVIPSSLIPSDERKPINKKRLFFASVVGSLLVLPVVIGLFSGLAAFLSPPLPQDKVFVVGLLAAFQCQVKQGRMTSERGGEILSQVARKNQLDPSVLQSRLLVNLANLYSQKLNPDCSKNVANEAEEIQRIYRKSLN